MTLESASQRSQNRRLGLILIATFSLMFIASVIYIIVYHRAGV